MGGGDCVSFSLPKGLSSTTSITVDFGDGTAISYVNISSIDDGIKHSYAKVGIYQVSATATNSLGSDRVMLYLHVSCESFKCSWIARVNNIKMKKKLHLLFNE